MQAATNYTAFEISLKLITVQKYIAAIAASQTNRYMQIRIVYSQEQPLVHDKTNTNSLQKQMTENWNTTTEQQQ